MLTYEDVTEYFLKAAAAVALVTHPEYWMNGRTLEREFACTCHTGPCDESEQQSACTVSFTWSTLDTALSLEGPTGVCDFFHEPGEDCPHLHTRDIPPLVLDLSYSLNLNGTAATISEATLLSLIQTLKMRASEHSSRAIETRPGVSMILHEQRLQPEAITLQQRVELPIWHPDGMRGLLEDRPSQNEQNGRASLHRHRDDDEEHEEEEVVPDNPHPEEWLPRIMDDVCQDIIQVLEALELVRSYRSLN
ncbi:MAG: hypothetical protein ACYDER_19220 [Ktedonobacteraceae bacterium]